MTIRGSPFLLPLGDVKDAVRRGPLMTLRGSLLMRALSVVGLALPLFLGLRLQAVREAAEEALNAALDVGAARLEQLAQRRWWRARREYSLLLRHHECIQVWRLRRGFCVNTAESRVLETASSSGDGA